MQQSLSSMMTVWLYCNNSICFSLANLVTRVLSYPPYGARERERERPWQTLVTCLPEPWERGCSLARRVTDPLFCTIQCLKETLLERSTTLFITTAFLAMGFHGILELADKMFFRGLEYKDIVAIINPANPFSFGLFQ